MRTARCNSDGITRPECTDSPREQATRRFHRKEDGDPVLFHEASPSCRRIHGNLAEASRVNTPAADYSLSKPFQPAGGVQRVSPGCTLSRNLPVMRSTLRRYTVVAGTSLSLQGKSSAW